MSNEKQILESINVNNTAEDDMGDNHIGSAAVTPLRDDAFELSDNEKIERIEELFGEIMQTLGLDLTDESLKGTPQRVAKMYVKEVFKGLNPVNKPLARKFSNNYAYDDMLVEKNIQVSSFCEHHFLPFIGKAHVGYFSSGQVIGLSKINRIVDFYSRRPQVQERLTLQIADELATALETDDVAVFIESKHLCVATRGIQDVSSSTVTSEFRGRFENEAVQQKFIDFIKTRTEM